MVEGEGAIERDETAACRRDEIGREAASWRLHPKNALAAVVLETLDRHGASFARIVGQAGPVPARKTMHPLEVALGKPKASIHHG